MPEPAVAPPTERPGYLPDSLKLEAEGWTPCPTGNPAYIRDHPTREDLGCRLWLFYETGQLCLMEHERRVPAEHQPGPLTLGPPINRFKGWCRDQADFEAVLRMARWTDS